MSISDSKQSNENSKQTEKPEKPYKTESDFRIRWERQFTPKKQHPFYRRKLTEAEKIRREQERKDLVEEMRQRMHY